MTNPKCLNVIHHNISLYILFHAILSYLNLTNPHKHICCGKKKRRMADTHLSIETTYITYPICYTMMLPNMPFRKADAHPLRLNTRCKDLTLVPSSWFWDSSCHFRPLSAHDINVIIDDQASERLEAYQLSRPHSGELFLKGRLRDDSRCSIEIIEFKRFLWVLTVKTPLAFILAEWHIETKGSCKPLQASRYLAAYLFRKFEALETLRGAGSQRNQ